MSCHKCLCNPAVGNAGWDKILSDGDLASLPLSQQTWVFIITLQSFRLNACQLTNFPFEMRTHAYHLLLLLWGEHGQSPAVSLLSSSPAINSVILSAMKTSFADSDTREHKLSDCLIAFEISLRLPCYIIMKKKLNCTKKCSACFTCRISKTFRNFMMLS